MEDKIRAKLENLYKGYKERDNGFGGNGSNIETYFTDTTLAMMKILKAELNLQMQKYRTELYRKQLSKQS